MTISPRLASQLLLAVLVTAAAPAHAQPKAGEDLPQITISDPNRNLLPLAIPNAAGDGALARESTEIARRNLTLVGLFRVLNPVSFPPALHAEGLGFSSALWTQVGAQAVVKMEAQKDAAGARLSGRLYRLGRGEAPVLSKDYKGSDLRTLVHAFTNDVIATLTGAPGVFGSRIVFARPKLELMSVGMDGAQAAVHTNMKSESILPVYSPGGDRIAFTNFMSRNPDLWVVSAGGGRARRISKRTGMNTGAAWMRDGRSLIATLSFAGNAELYQLDADSGNIVKRLTDNDAIDSSADVSADGSQIAFVSNRQGTPQIFVMPVGGGAAKRVTFRGNYNQTPRWSPRKDKSLIAFTGRDERGVFDIFIVDVKSGEVKRMTQNKGSNYDPAWSPDGRLLVYASSRGGLFVVNPDTLSEVQVWRGNARSPSWGPVPKAMAR